MTSSVLYGPLPKVSSKVRQRRVRLADNAIQHCELTLHSAVLREPLHRHASRGRTKTTFVDMLRLDVDLQETLDIQL